jgi:predicted O-methyltransferase YrrM
VKGQKLSQYKLNKLTESKYDYEFIYSLSKELKAMPITKEKLKIIEKIVNCFELTKKCFFLEIGSGIGWSFINFSKIFNIKSAILIEKDNERAKILLENIKNFLNEKTENIDYFLINRDALLFLKEEKNFILDKLKKMKESKEDFLKVAFIDANKSKYLDYLLLLEDLNFDILIFDNSFFHLRQDINKEKNKTIIKKLEKFHDYLLKKQDFHLLHFKKGDGLTILIKK